MKKSIRYAFLAVIIWSTLSPVAKLVINDIPNLESLTISSFVAVIFWLIVNLATKKILLIKNYGLTDLAKMAGLGFIGLFAYTGLYYYGIGILGSDQACILNYLWPIIVVVFSCILLKEQVTARKIFALVCSFIGIVIITLGNGGSSFSSDFLAILACIGAAVCYGLYSVLNKIADYDQNISMMIFWAVTGVCSFILGRATEEWIPIHGTTWIGIIWNGVMVSAIAYFSWALAMKYAGKSTAGIANFAYLTPFLSLIVAALLLGEKIRLIAVIALLFIVGGILIQSINLQA